MRAARCLALDGIASVALADVPDPIPGPGEALVRVRAAAVNFPDLLLLAGRYQVRLEPPFTPGSELAGEVVATGPGVDGVALGDRVCASVFSGAFAELAAVPAASLLRVDPGTSLEAAAGFRVAYTTAHHALHAVGALEPGQWVVVLGAAGGVGMATIDLARLHGARIIAVASTREKLEACRAAGAEVLIDAGRDDLKTMVKQATGGGAHLVVDPVGGDLTEPALRALRPGGRLVVVGFASGTVPRIPLNLVLIKAISVHAVELRHLYAAEAHLSARVTAELLDHLGAGRIRPHISHRFDLEDVIAALRVVEERRAIGKVLVLPNPSGPR